MKNLKNQIALFLAICLMAFAQNSRAQDVSINIISSPSAVPHLSTTGRVYINVCNNDGGSTNAAIGKIRPSITFPSSLVGASVIGVSVAGWSIVSNNGTTIVLENMAVIAPGECSEIELGFTGQTVGGPGTVTGTLTFSGAAPFGNLTGNDVSTTSITVLVDTDGDLVANVDDLDDDNDGILDSDELADTDGDGVQNSLELDSDNDGCKDVVESGGVDANNDGKLDGTGFGANGLVTGGTGGYNGVTGNEALAHDITIATSPANVVSNAAASFTVGANIKSTSTYTAGVPNYTASTASTAGLTYQWFDGNPASGGVALTNSGVYTGVQSATLNISNVAGLNGKQFYVSVAHSSLICPEIVSASLTVVTITAVTEIGSAAATGGTAIANVRANDLINGVAATAVNSSISQSGTWPSGITLNTTTGAIIVANGTAAGVYAVTYQLCDLNTPIANCQTVSNNITVTAVINPVTENGSIAATGGIAVANVRANDFVNGLAATAINSTIAQSGTWPSGITLNTTTGAISVANGTALGVYPVSYQLCDLASPTANCQTVSVNITVTAVINPVTENGSIAATGGIAVANVRANDFVNGLAATAINSTIAQSGTWPSGITLNTTTGAISVANGTALGVYPVTYQLCDLASPTANCQTVSVNITVTAIINPVTENGSIAATGGIAVANVRANDFVNGLAATAINSTIAQSGTWPSGITLNTTTGAISVANGTALGVYPISYQLCDLASPTANCQTVSVNITVTAIINPVTENGSIAATGGTAIANVRANDFVNGLAATAINSTISQSGTWPLGITLNTTTGAIEVASGRAIGVYAVTYQLCDLASPTANCQTVTNNITVTAVINPVTENGSIAATGGTAIANVRANDFVNALAATVSNSTISQSGTWPSGITLNTTSGAILVANGTMPGVYAVTYQLCDLASPTANCQTVSVNITVTAVINPVTENGSIAATGGTAIANVRANDFVNGLAATAINSTISQSGTWPLGITLNTTTGAIEVASGRAVGVYAVTYQLCDLASPTANCQTVTNNITVTAVINPVTENGSIAATGGIAVANVRANDFVNGLAATVGNSTISQSGTWPSGITLNITTGAISVANGTALGVYAVTYQLCDLATPTANCQTVSDNITVTAIINPVTESGTIPNSGGIAVANVRANDFVNGLAATALNSTISQSGTWPAGITLNTSTGAISVAIGTAPGVYSVTYQLCDLSSPTPNCQTVANSITVSLDTDSDGVADINDLDDDNDGILDTIEDAAICTSATGINIASVNCDSDAIPNRLDLDSDNDGINDVIEAGGTDANNDGVADGTPNANGIPSSAGTGLTPLNTDGLGGSNAYDLDSDDDNQTDFLEAGLNPIFDANGDGFVDGNSDTDGDGILNLVDTKPTIWGDASLPDLSPTTEISSLSFANAGDEKDFVVNIFEVQNTNNLAASPIAFRVAKLSAFDMTYTTTSGTSNVFGLVNNNNSNWTFVENTNFITVTAKAGVSVPANGNNVVGFKVKRKTGVPSNTSQNITVTIIYGSAGEEKVGNNIVETKITAN